MTRYIVPICDISESMIYTPTFTTQSISDCQDKVMEYVKDKFNLDNVPDEYHEFIDNVDVNNDIIIGNILDIETL